MSGALEESLHEQVKSVAREFDRRHEQLSLTASESMDDPKQARYQGKADAFEQAATRLRVVLDGGDGDE